jgi:probable F420-dependent oxidoreductase
VVPYRNPFLLAKSVATLDVLSGGRLILGVGGGYLEPEFQALGADFEHRNAVIDANLVTAKAIWTGEPVAAEGPMGTTYHRVLPRPVQRPHPPIWVGGNSKTAIRRAVELCDGWMPMPNPASVAKRRRSPVLETVDDLAGRLRYAAEHAAAVGRTAPLDVMFMPLVGGTYGTPGWDREATLAGIAELTALGVTQLAVGFHTDTRAELVDLVQGFAAEVVRATP